MGCLKLPYRPQKQVRSTCKTEYSREAEMVQCFYLPNGTFSLGNPDYIYRPPSPENNTEDLARKAVILEPGTSIVADTIETYLAMIDSTGGGTPFNGLQTMDYSWHIRGGLRGINLNPSGNPTPDVTQGDLFSYKLDYETAGQWGGNIGKQSWNHVNGANPVGVRDYTFTYDGLDRLKSAAFSSLSDASENYSLPNITYDKNGNILNLQRNGKLGSSYGLMDNLTYTYSGNRLTSVTDAISGDHEVDFVPRGSGAYTYYENGALKSDVNKEITNIIYNTYLNKPAEIQLTGGRWVKMTYDGAGTLLKREFSTGEYWEYVHGLIYKNGQPFSLNIPDGRAVYKNGNWVLQWFYQDHLENTRVTFSADGDRLVKEDATDFDAMGIQLGTGFEGNPENRFKLQNKESLTLFGLGGITDFSARYLDNTLGRMWGVDALSERGYRYSPYNYVFNNPIRYVDPDGNWPWPNPSSLINKAKNYVVSKAIETTTRVVAATVNYAVNRASEALASTTIEPNAQFTISAGAQAVGKIDKTAGGGRNLGSFDLVQVKIGAELSSDGFKNTSEIKYMGQDGNVNLRSSYNNNVTIPVAEVPLGLGFDMEHNVNYKSGVKTEQNFSESQGVSVFGINTSLGVERDIQGKRTNLKVTSGVGGEAALGVGIRGSAGVDVKIPLRKKED